jgi:hypothetical protein
MSKDPKDEKALLEEYARALAVVGEAPASTRSDRLRTLGLTTMAFLDLSRDASAAMDRALDAKNDEAIKAFAGTFEAERARLRAGGTAEASGNDTTDPGPPPDFGAWPEVAPAAPGRAPLAPVPFAPPVAANPAEERRRPAAPPMLNRAAPEAAAPMPASIAPVPPAPAAPAAAPIAPPLGRGTLRMVVNPGGSVQARVLSAAVAAVAPMAARGGDTVFDPTQLPMLPAVPPRAPPSAIMPPISAPSAAVLPAPRDTAASGPRPGMAPRLNLMEYAALRGEILVSSDADRAEVYALFGLTEADDAEEAAAWNARFTRDRALFARYMQLFNYLRALRGGKP